MNRATSSTGWVRNPDGTLGWTWNPVTGCYNHTNGLCKAGDFPCYAHKLANGRVYKQYLANNHYAQDGVILKPAAPRKTPSQDPFYPRFWCSRENELYNRWMSRSRSSIGVFVCDMGDLFGCPVSWTNTVLIDIRDYGRPGDIFYLLTKQYHKLIKFSPFPNSCYVGVTCTNQSQLTEACDYLSSIKAILKYISFEPLLCSMQTSDYILQELYLGGVKWIIIGSLTGTLGEIKQVAARYPELTPMPYKTKWTLQPPFEWVKELVDAADAAGIKVFLKDNLWPLFVDRKLSETSNVLKIIKGNDHHAELRQELPE